MGVCGGFGGLHGSQGERWEISRRLWILHGGLNKINHYLEVPIKGDNKNNKEPFIGISKFYRDKPK